MYKFLIRGRIVHPLFIDKCVTKRNIHINPFRKGMVGKYLNLADTLEELKKSENLYLKDIEKINHKMKDMQNTINRMYEDQKQWIKNQKFNEAFSEDDKKFYREKIMELILENKERINKLDEERYGKEIKNIEKKYERQIAEYEMNIKNNISQIMEEYQNENQKKKKIEELNKNDKNKEWLGFVMFVIGFIILFCGSLSLSYDDYRYDYVVILGGIIMLIGIIIAW